MTGRVTSYGDRLAADDLGDHPFLDHVIAGPVMKAVCPACGIARLPETIVDVRALPPEVTRGASFACDGCLARWEIEDRQGADGMAFDEAMLLDCYGAPTEEVARVREAKAARVEKYKDSAGRHASRAGVVNLGNREPSE